MQEELQKETENDGFEKRKGNSFIYIGKMG